MVTTTILQVTQFIYATQNLPYFLKYSRSKIFADEHNLCISEIIRASKLRGWAVSAKINTPRKLSVAKVNRRKNWMIAFACAFYLVYNYLVLYAVRVLHDGTNCQPPSLKDFSSVFSIYTRRWLYLMPSDEENFDAVKIFACEENFRRLIYASYTNLEIKRK